MKRFFYNLLMLGFSVSLITTWTMWSRSYKSLDEWHGWNIDEPGHFTLMHVYVLSNFGRVEVMATRSQRSEWSGRLTALPDSQIPKYPVEQLQTREPTRADWTYIDKYFPEAVFKYGVTWGQKSTADLADGTKPGSSYLSNMSPKRHEDRWMLGVQYKDLAWLFGIPLIWKAITGKRKKPVAVPQPSPAALNR